jgi:hypothetical protein
MKLDKNFKKGFWCGAIAASIITNIIWVLMYNLLW